MQEGMVADITIFDPETVAEGSDYKTGMNGMPPKGLPHVTVNGLFVKPNERKTLYWFLTQWSMTKNNRDSENTTKKNIGAHGDG